MYNKHARCFARLLASAIFAFGTYAEAQDLAPYCDPAVSRFCRYFGRDARRAAIAYSDLGLAFQAFPPSGAGMPFVQNLCDQLTPAEFAGGLCVNADGTMRVGSIDTLLLAGSARTMVVCPSGSNCTSEATRVYLSGEASAGASLAGPAGNFSACVVMQAGVSGNYGDSWLHGTNTIAPSNFNWQLGLAAVNPGQFTVSNGTLQTQVNTTIGSFAAGAWYVLCGTYQRVGGAANNVAKLYHNGALDTTSSTAVLVAATSRSHRIQGSSGDTVGLGVRGAFWVPTLLSDARIQAISNAVLAAPITGSRGEVLTLTRASERFCWDWDAGGSDLPPGRPCVANGGIDVAPAQNYLLLRNQDLPNAVWAPVGTAFTYNDFLLAPNGTTTADMIEVVAPASGRSQTVATSSAVRYSVGSWIRGNSVFDTAARIRIVGTGSSSGDATCNFSITTNWQWYTCVSPAAYGVGLTAITVFLELDSGRAGFWRVGLVDQSETSPAPLTEASTYPTAPDFPNFAVNGLSTARGCAQATFVPRWNGADGRFSKAGLVYNSDSDGRLIYLTSATQANIFDGVNDTPVNLASSWIRAVAKTLRGSYGPAGLSITDGTNTATSAFDGQLGASAATLSVGYVGFLFSFNGVIRDIRADPERTRCGL